MFGRTYKSICIDIDGKDNPSISDMEEFKKKLSKLPYMMYCGLSASGKGLFCIIPYKDYRNHKLHFNALEQEFKDMGRTILFVSHDLSSISRYCDRVVLLNKGVKLAEGSPKKMVDMYKQLLVGQDPAKAAAENEKKKTRKLE